MENVLLITGASSDIATELLRRIEKNYDVIFAQYCHTPHALEEIRKVSGNKLHLIQSDFSDSDSVSELVETIAASGYHPSHIVHFPASKIFCERFHKCSWENFECQLQISLQSVVKILGAFLPNMIKAKRGKVIFMLTSDTLNQPPKYQSSYVTVKYALLGLMRALAVEYAEKGIMINGVSPDMVETKFLSELPELMVRQYAQQNPLKRNLTVEDVVPAFEYLLSPAADMVSGQNIGITGGR